MRRVEHCNALREENRELAVAVGDDLPELLVLALDPVEVRALPAPGGVDVEREHEGLRGQQAAGDTEVQLEHVLHAEPAGNSLVGERRVDVPVADHPGPSVERRLDHPRDVLRAGGGEESRLRPGSHVEPVQDDVADRLAEWRAARLAGLDDLVTLPTQPLGEQCRLRRLPRSVLSLEADEHRGSTIRPVRAAVTGGAGFIGSNLVDALVERGDDVVVVDDLSFGRREFVNPAATLVERDIRDGIDVDGSEVVFHLAAQTDVQTSVREPAHDAQVNVVGTVKVAEAALRAGARMVFTSTGGAIYGECDGPATEESPRLPLSPYGIAKLCAEEYLQRAFNRIPRDEARHVVARLGNVFGPRQSASLEGGVVALFFDRFARGDGTVIFGDGLQTRDFIYVGDVVSALLAASAHEGGGVFNVGTGTELTVLALHQACAEAAGVTAEPAFEPARLGDLRRSALDVSLARAELGLTAGTPLADGLAATWAWAIRE